MKTSFYCIAVAVFYTRSCLVICNKSFWWNITTVVGSVLVAGKRLLNIYHIKQCFKNVLYDLCVVFGFILHLSCVFLLWLPSWQLLFHAFVCTPGRWFGLLDGHFSGEAECMNKILYKILLMPEIVENNIMNAGQPEVRTVIRNVKWNTRYQYLIFRYLFITNTKRQDT